MAAKTMSEAIYTAICFGPLSGVEKRLRGEIRDYLSHEVSRYVTKNKCIEQYDVLAAFITHVLKHIPVNGGKE